MILLVDKIEKSFGARVLFSGASFQINPGERFALVGPNGAGKTTMLKIIMGIDSPDAGQVQDYAQPAMAWAVAENIIQGMEDGTLKPAGNASRAQIATILMRFCEDVAQ